MRECLLLLGERHAGFGDLEVRTQRGGATALAISAGSDADDGATIFKGDLAVPNEDVVLAIDDGGRTLLAVADGHHGHEASHGLLEALSQASVPAQPFGLMDAILGLGRPSAGGQGRTTLLALVVDREAGRGFGLGFGDSSAMVVTASGGVSLARKNTAYVAPWEPHTLDPRRAQEFVFEVEAGDMVLVFTDGVDECHYRRPESSVQLAHILDLGHELADNPEAFATALGILALDGVDGHPGGQDNLAIGVTLV